MEGKRAHAPNTKSSQYPVVSTLQTVQCYIGQLSTRCMKMTYPICEQPLILFKCCHILYSIRNLILVIKAECVWLLE